MNFSAAHSGSSVCGKCDGIWSDGVRPHPVWSAGNPRVVEGNREKWWRPHRDSNPGFSLERRVTLLRVARILLSKTRGVGTPCQRSVRKMCGPSTDGEYRRARSVSPPRPRATADALRAARLRRGGGATGRLLHGGGGGAAAFRAGSLAAARFCRHEPSMRARAIRVQARRRRRGRTRCAVGVSRSRSGPRPRTA
jgi:hypothetical protein